MQKASTSRGNIKSLTGTPEQVIKVYTERRSHNRKVMSNFARHKAGADSLDPISLDKIATSDELKTERLNSRKQT